MITLALLAEVGTYDGLDAYDLVWTAAAVVTIGAALAAIHRWLWVPGCARMRRYDAAVDLILGYGPITDPATGLVLQDAKPPLAMRVTTMEATVAALAAAEASRAEADVIREQTTAQLADIAERLTEHETWSERWVAEAEAWQRDHVADVEQVHAEMWRAIRGHTHDD